MDVKDLDPLGGYRELKGELEKALPSIGSAKPEGYKYIPGVMPPDFWANCKLSPATRASMEKAARVRTYNFALPRRRTKSVEANWKRQKVKKQIFYLKYKKPWKHLDKKKYMQDPEYSFRKYRDKASKRYKVPFEIDRDAWAEAARRAAGASPVGRFNVVRLVPPEGFVAGNVLFKEYVQNGYIGHREKELLAALRSEVLRTGGDIGSCSLFEELKKYINIYSYI